MSNDNTKVLEQIIKNFTTEAGNPNKIRLPGNIEFKIMGKEVNMHISSTSVTMNMQEDAAAFEGWALVIKRWGKFDKIILSWDSPPPLFREGHYQRFLFRVMNFSEDFQSWFSVSPDSQSLREKLRIKDAVKYYLNSPSKNRKSNESKRPESELERKFVSGEYSGTLKTSTNANFLDNQLPVGVFEGEIKKENSIFTGGKSAIDIWGITNDNELLLFELKADGNNKVGIISELYFYCCLMRNVQKGRFKYKKSHSSSILDLIVTTIKINAFFMAPDRHPLIDKLLIEYLNSGTEHYAEFKFLQFQEKEEILNILH